MKITNSQTGTISENNNNSNMPEEQYIYTVELHDIIDSRDTHELCYCSTKYEDSLSELKGLSEQYQQCKSVLVAWYKGKPQFEQWAIQYEVGAKIYYNDDYYKQPFQRFTGCFLKSK